ncbi:MAG: hypothetical protein WC022_03950 [Parcubacteria group bacterium]
MLPLIKFPGKLPKKLSEEDILRSIEEVIILGKTNSLLIVFSEKIQGIDIERFSRYFAAYFSHKNNKGIFLSLHLLDVSKNQGNALLVDLSKPKKGSRIVHILREMDEILLVHVATDTGRRLKLIQK